MPSQNLISISEDGNITIRDAQSGQVVLRPGDPGEMATRLRQLNEPVIDILLQVVDTQSEKITDALKELIKGIAKEKNIVKGSISHVGLSSVGDNNTINYHYHNPESRLPKELTWRIPKIHPEDIIGREEDLQQLHEYLCNKKRVVLVNGLGGIGKTTLVQAYISQYYHEYHHIAWITQSNKDISRDFNNDRELTPNLGIATSNLEPDQLFAEIIRKLKAIHQHPCLLIIDNAEISIKEYLDILPSQPQWHLLVTSREAIPGLQLQPLGFLNEEQAIALFKKYYTHKQIRDEDIQDLVKTVDYHTLTIEILAKTAAVQRYDPATLKQAIENNLKAGIDNVAHQGYGTIERVTTYLQKVFNLGHLDTPERWLMVQFACLPSEFHPYELLKELLIDNTDEWAAIFPEKMFDLFPETMARLVQKGWLLENKETDSYKMHRIIAEVVKKEETIDITTIPYLFTSITNKLNRTETDNPIDKFVWIPFGKALLSIPPAQELDEIASRLQTNLAMLLKEQGDYPAAKELLEKAVQANEKNLGPDHTTTANSYSYLAMVLSDMGKYANAKALIEKTLPFFEKNLGANHPTTANNYANLALVLRDLGDYQRAKKLLEKAVQSHEKNFGPHHPTTAIAYMNLAAVLQHLGNYPAAKQLLEKAIKYYEETLGPDHPNTAISYSNLATVLRNLGDYRTAKALMEKAIQSNEKNLGLDHPTTANSYSNLAMILKDLGSYQRAIQLLEKAIRSEEKNFGPDHPTTAVSYSNLGSLFHQLGNYLAAKELLQRSMRSHEKNFGPHHPVTARAYSNLAVTLYRLGDIEQAMALSKKAMTITKKVLPAGHPDIEEITQIYQQIKRTNR